jgi:hypothetical protein
MYKIVINYETGDSFRSESASYILKCSTLEIAKENLKRIKEHWAYYSWAEDDRRGWAEGPKPKIPSGTKIEDHYGSPRFCLSLATEKDEWLMRVPPWCGYFETLHDATIEPDENIDSDMKFSVRKW